MDEVVATTERLILRDWREEDRESFYAVMNTAPVMQWLGGVQTPDEWQGSFDRTLALARDFGHTLWIVERKADRELLGFCGLKRVNSPGGEPLHGQFEIGWRLREDAWGQGYAKEAAIAAMDLAFDRFGAPHVVALTVAGNLPSQGLMKRLGMLRREDLDFVGRFSPGSAAIDLTIVYRIDAADWPAARAAALA